MGFHGSYPLVMTNSLLFEWDFYSDLMGYDWYIPSGNLLHFAT